MLALLRFLARLWSLAGLACLLIGAAIFAAPRLGYTLPVGGPAPTAIGVAFLIVGVVLLSVGGRAARKAFGAQIDEKRRRSVREQRSREAYVDSQRVQLAAEVWAVVARVTAEHRETLSAKREKLVTLDDYNKPVTDAWDEEVRYFWSRVVKPELTRVCSAQAYRAALDTALRESGDPEMRKAPEEAMQRAVARRVQAELDRGASSGDG